MVSTTQVLDFPSSTERFLQEIPIRSEPSSAQFHACSYLMLGRKCETAMQAIMQTPCSLPSVALFIHPYNVQTPLLLQLLLFEDCRSDDPTSRIVVRYLKLTTITLSDCSPGEILSSNLRGVCTSCFMVLSSGHCSLKHPSCYVPLIVTDKPARSILNTFSQEAVQPESQ